MNNKQIDKTQIDVQANFIQLPAKEFAGKLLSREMLSQIIVSLQSNQRRSTAHTKTRSYVAGSTRKPWRQKGTGRARVGTRQTPLWRGGGIVFGPDKKRNFSKKINKKIKTPALSLVLSHKAKAGAVVEFKKVPEFSKTKEVISFLSPALVPKNNLIVLKANDSLTVQALRNISYIKIVLPANLGLVDVASARRIIFFPGALEVLKARLVNLKK